MGQAATPPPTSDCRRRHADVGPSTMPMKNHATIALPSKFTPACDRPRSPVITRHVEKAVSGASVIASKVPAPTLQRHFVTQRREQGGSHMRLEALPLRWLSDAVELRRLRRRLPNVHRAWSRASGKLQPESDAEYLARLRSLAREREQLRNTTERSRRPGNLTFQ
jgi:hypothetical protein